MDAELIGWGCLQGRLTFLLAMRSGSKQITSKLGTRSGFLSFYIYMNMCISEYVYKCIYAYT